MRYFKAVVLAFISLLFLFSAGCSASVSSQAGGLIISEVVASNSNSLVDPVLGKPDWVELSNTSSGAIDIKDYSIAESNSKKYIFPDTVIEPGSYLLVYFCQTPDNNSSNKLCTGFKLSKGGGNLILSSQNGLIQSLKVPSLETDISYGITSSGSYAYFGSPTPGAANNVKYSEDIKSLESSADVQLKINEAMPQSVSSSEPYGWAEIYNAGQNAVELSDYCLSDDPSNPTKTRLPKNKLESGGYAVVKFTGEAGGGDVPFNLNKSETSLVLSNNFGTLIDKLTWDESIIPGISAGHGDNGKAVYYPVPTPGAKNGSDYITGISLKQGAGIIRINEILFQNKYSIADSDGDRFPWVELYNTTGAPLSLAGCALSDDKNSLMKWSFPDVTIDANSYTIVFLSGKNKTGGNELHTSFKLGNEDTQLCFTDLKKGTVQVVDLPGDRKDNVSYGLSSDGTWLYYDQPTPSAANTSEGFKQISDIKSGNTGLKINEVVSVNQAKSHQPDWVEIYNSSSKSIALKGYYLSDSLKDLKKWPFGNMTVKAGGYSVMNGYDTGTGASEISISQSGETLYLSDPDGVVIDAFDTGVLRPGYSSGLKADGTKALFANPTIGTANGGNTVEGFCSEPVFSAPGGHQKGSVTLTITTATEGAGIYYTLDGSTPDSGSAKYTGPIQVSANKTVKAIAVKAGMMDSDPMVATYLFDAPHSLPVICLSVSQSNLNVISSANKKSKPEREGYVEYYGADGVLGVRFPAGLRATGAGTIGYKQRSFNIYLRGAYGQSSVTYPFFDGYNVTTFKSLTLRHMGAWQDPSLLKDVFIQMAANGMNVDNTQTRLAAVYINGSYWGLYEFKENQNEDYFASKYDIDPNKVVMVRDNKWNVDTSHGYKAVSDMVNLLSFAKGNINDSADWAKYTGLTDSDHFMDYLIAETFFACNDWYNQKYAHTTDDTLKWRPVYYDFDYSFASPSNNTFRLMTQQEILRGSGEHTDCSLYYSYYKNPQWRDAFVKRYAYVLNNILTTDKLLSEFDGLAASVKDEMPRTIQRWGMPSSESKWNSLVSGIRNTIKERRQYILKQLKGEFGLSDSEMKDLFPNG